MADGVEITPAQIKVPDDKIAVLTGPILGSVTAQDGTVHDVSGPVTVVDTWEEAEEVLHLVGLRYQAEGHPHDVDIDPKTGKRVQREFVYEVPKKFKNYKPYGTE